MVVTHIEIWQTIWSGNYAQELTKMRYTKPGATLGGLYKENIYLQNGGTFHKFKQ